QTLEARGGSPYIALASLPFEQAVADPPQSHFVSPKHGTAPVHRPAVSVHPDDVDVARPDGDLLVEDLCSLVDHPAEQPRENLIVGARPARHPELGRKLEDDSLDLRIGSRRAVGAVSVVPGSGLLTEPAELAETVRDDRLLAESLADPPAHVETGEIVHRKGA